MDSTFKVSPFNVPFHGDFLRGVFVELRLVSFESVEVLPRDERVLRSLLEAVVQAFRVGLVFHHVRRAAHRIAHDTCQRFLLDGRLRKNHHWSLPHFYSRTSLSYFLLWAI